MIKRNKSKYILYTLLGLTLVSVTSVGFSSWIINNTKSDTTSDFTISFGDVVDNSITAELVSDECDLSISFDALSSELCTNEITNGDGKTEDLNYKVVFNLTRSAGTSLANTLLSFEYSDGADTFKNTLSSSTKEYINSTCLTDFTYTLPSSDKTDDTNNINTAVKVSVNYTDTTYYSSCKVTCNFSFSWGNVFNDKNPCISDVKDIANQLTLFKTAYSSLSNNVINLTITPSLGSNN